ncbi:MAG: hypothetical protein ACLUOL_02060, partial [Faecalibacterium sp.]
MKKNRLRCCAFWRSVGGFCFFRQEGIAAPACPTRRSISAMQIFNTLTRQKEEFVPQVPGE